MSKQPPEPFEPNAPPLLRSETDDPDLPVNVLVRQVRENAGYERVLISLMLGGVGTFLALAGIELARYGGLPAIGFGLLVLEPAALICALGVALFLLPHQFTAHLFLGTLRRLAWGLAILAAALCALFFAHVIR